MNLSFYYLLHFMFDIMISGISLRKYASFFLNCRIKISEISGFVIHTLLIFFFDYCCHLAQSESTIVEFRNVEEVQHI